MYRQGLGLRLAVRTPYPVENEVLPESLSLVCHKQVKESEFLCRQIEGDTILFCTALGKVEGDIAVGELVDSEPASEYPFYFSDKYIYIIGLLDVVVSAEEYAVELVLLVC